MQSLFILTIKLQPFHTQFEGEEGDCGLYSGTAIFQENTADNDRRLPNKINKGKEKQISPKGF